MVHDRCVVGVCNNDKRYPERLEVHSNVTSGNISFHKLPAHLERRRAWIHAVEKGRKDFVVPKHFKVCSNHFVDGKPTPNNPDPTLFLTVTMNVQGTPVKRQDPHQNQDKFAFNHLIPARRQKVRDLLKLWEWRTVLLNLMRRLT